MSFTIEPTALQSGTVTVPGDKSISHRALMLSAVATGDSRINGFLPGEDCLATLGALRAMGVGIEQPQHDEVIVSGVGLHGLQAPAAALDMGNSGTGMRLFSGLLAGQRFSSELGGDASLSARPMNRVVKPLTMMGADIQSADGKPPLVIQGSPLHGLVYSSPVASAQVKSAVLFAGLYASGEIVFVEPAVTRDHTERMFRSMQVELDTGESQISMSGGQAPRATDIEVPGDLSSAAFLLLAAILSADAAVTVTGVGVNPTRTGCLEILKEMGADISIDNVRLFGEEPVADLTARASNLKGIDVDPGLVSLAIDEFPILFIAAARASGKTRFAGLEELRVKESDRIASMADGLRALSVSIEETSDGAVIHGGKIYGGTVKSYGDHRVAMAFAVAGTVAEWAVSIAATDAVNTSYPGFAATLKALGIEIAAQPDVRAE